jgi:hypothetical protein
MQRLLPQSLLSECPCACCPSVRVVLLAEMRRKPPEGLSPLLDLLRICSVETIEAVALWREAMVRQNHTHTYRSLYIVLCHPCLFRSPLLYS